MRVRTHHRGQVDAPPYQTHEGFCDGFILFLEQLGVETVRCCLARSSPWVRRAHLTPDRSPRRRRQVHLFGTSLGGLLVQVFAHSRTNRIESLILCNAYCDTRPFAANAPFLGLYARRLNAPPRPRPRALTPCGGPGDKPRTALHGHPSLH